LSVSVKKGTQVYLIDFPPLAGGGFTLPLKDIIVPVIPKADAIRRPTSPGTILQGNKAKK